MMMKKFKFLNRNLSKRVLILGSSGIISLSLQKYLKNKKIPFKVYGKSKINLIENKNIFKLKKIISKRIVLFSYQLKHLSKIIKCYTTT